MYLTLGFQEEKQEVMKVVKSLFGEDVEGEVQCKLKQETDGEAVTC